MKFKQIALAIGIVILLNIFFNYGIFTFYKSPEYTQFCPETLYSKNIQTEKECTDAGGLWHYSGPEVQKAATATGAVIMGYCDITYTCNKEYTAVREIYDRNVFIVLTILGIITLILGLTVISVDAVANGFLFGGILSILVGVIRYWSAMDDYLRFIISGIALVLLIWVGYKKINK